ncbi:MULTISPECIES: hypothetical protein [unclassified Streptomyces]|uniref:hypothetical protein n=1 Tax=unclassified Streptomyces TaxID=2593676 RepID=UPI0037F2E40F
MGGSRRGHIRGTRPTALVSAVATLFVALLVCLGGGPGADGTHHEEPATATVMSVAAPEPEPAEARYSCPYDKGACGFFPHLNPAVLTAPPPVAPLADAVQPTYLAPPPPTGQVSRSAAPARAPDLHVLQVLRT